MLLSCAPVKANSIISFHTGNINHQAKVLSRAEKALGKYKSCCNTEYLSPDYLMGKQTWIGFDNIDTICGKQKLQKLTR